MSHSVSWIPERYEVSINHSGPVNDLVLDSTATEMIYFDVDDDESDDDEPEVIMLVDIGYPFDNEDDYCNIIVDRMELPEMEVWYVWRSTRMENSAPFTPEQTKQISVGIVATMTGFMSARIETYRRLYPGRKIVTGVMWLNMPPYFDLPS